MKLLEPIDLLKSVYLGDRGVEWIQYDNQLRQLKVCVDLISRVRASDGEWSFYSKEDLKNGILVFDGVSGLHFDPSGSTINSFLHALEFEALGGGNYRCVIEGDFVDPKGTIEEEDIYATIRFNFMDFFLVDQNRPENEIRT